MIEKFLNSKITDKQFKLLFFFSVGVIFIITSINLMSVNSILDKYYEYTNKQKIIIMDEQGNMFQKTIFEGKQEMLVVFATAFTKQILSLDYYKKDEKINYVKTYTTTRAFEIYEKFIKDNQWINDTDLLKGNYNGKIEEFKIKTKENEYFFKTNVNFNSEIKQSNIPLYVKIKLIEGMPTENNSLGIFVDNIEYITQSEIEQKYTMYLEQDKN